MHETDWKRERAIPRSWLFVPADSRRKIEKAAATAADALIFDLEDSVAEPNKAKARRMAREALEERANFGGKELWVRINGFGEPDGALALADLAAIVERRPDGIMLPKSESGPDVIKLDHYLAALEAASGCEIGRTRIIPVATESAQALFTLDSYAGATSRLDALTWGAEDLAADLGAATNQNEAGEYLFTYQLARSLCLAGAAAARVPAIDTVFTNFRDLPALEASAAQARRDGFAGKLAIHPDQIPAIHRAFTPSESEVAEARRVIESFDSGAGTAGLEGKMLDRPHYIQALRILRMAGRRSGEKHSR